MPDTATPARRKLKGISAAIIWAGILSSLSAQPASSDLHSGWKFRKAGDHEWLTASVPGSVHTDLLNNKKIPDPFFSDNEKNLQWIDTCDWEYETHFNVEESDLHKNSELVFEGLDTYAAVYLNDSLLYVMNNMFRTWKVDCGNYLKKGANSLFIRFSSATKRGREEAKKLSYTLPGEEKVYTRKAQYHYGWDWGPRFVTCGIWRPVKLNFWDSFKIDDVHVVTEKLDSAKAVLYADISVTAARPSEIDFVFSIQETGQTISGKEKVIPGHQIVRLNFEITNPKRWWCNGSGEAFQYHFILRAINSDQASTKEISYGLRTIELVQEKDAIGRSFFFKLNGVPVFMKGANWIPGDNFLPRVNHEKYLRLLLSAKEANMNMLRVWGGGVYEEDAFYDLCDSLGILVWQDFMFACAMYPGDSAFIENVESEITDNVIRLRNHPGIALWCGNNENDEGWKNWGWQKQFSYAEKDSATIWNDYLKVFHQLIPGKLTQLDPTRPYWPSSPSIGWGRKESLQQGDSHYWGVWWGMEAFEVYKKKVGRFMSEYGFQGMPSIKAIHSFSGINERTLQSVTVKSHQKHPKGFETIEHYMKEWYPEPKDFESYVYVSQLLQAEGMRVAIEAHRRAKPFCMGSLYWQLNDCWPVTSWSSIDYSGEWKAVHYAVKESFAQCLISVQDTGQLLSVYLVSDEKVSTEGDLFISLVSFSGTVLWQDSIHTQISNEYSNMIYSKRKQDVVAGHDPSKTLLKLDLRRNKEQAAEKIYYFKFPRELHLDKPEIKYTLEKQNDVFKISLETNTLARNVCLELKEKKGRFSENYFDLLPNESKTVIINSPHDLREIQQSLVIKSLADSF